jgi:hypothetical protein
VIRTSTISVTRPEPATSTRPEPSLSARALHNVLVIAGIVAVVVAVIVLWGFGGWEYYRAPLATRGYLPMHRWLRPSGPVGLSLGIAGLLAVLSTLPYAVRKRWRPLAGRGTVKGWLEFHIFFGIVGPIVITFHTSFKFNGIVSAAYWLMMTVWASGFVGRYLYVRIPRSIRGLELTRGEVDARLTDLRNRLLDAPLPDSARRELDAFESAIETETGGAPDVIDLFLGELRVRVRLWMLGRHLRDAGVDLELLHDTISVASERAALARRAAHLERTRRFFELWHVFHRPLVYAMFLIVALHVAVAVYLGYVDFGS